MDPTEALDPESQQFLTVGLQGKEVEALGPAAEALAREAADSLQSSPFAAAFYSFAAGVLTRLRLEFERSQTSRAKPAAAAAGKRVSASGKLAKPAPGPSRIKHRYDSAGTCTLDHGNGRCGLTRQRAPRSGSSAEAAAKVLPGQRSIDDQLATAAGGGAE